MGSRACGGDSLFALAFIFADPEACTAKFDELAAATRLAQDARTTAVAAEQKAGAAMEAVHIERQALQDLQRQVPLNQQVVTAFRAECEKFSQEPVACVSRLQQDQADLSDRAAAIETERQEAAQAVGKRELDLQAREQAVAVREDRLAAA